MTMRPRCCWRRWLWPLLVSVACVLAVLAAVGSLGARPVAANAPALSLLPDRDPCDSQTRRAIVRGTSFPAGITVALYAKRIAPYPSNQARLLAEVPVAADRTFAFEFEPRFLYPQGEQGS